MGWSDSHLHRFHIHGKDYGVAHEGGIWFDRKALDEFDTYIEANLGFIPNYGEHWRNQETIATGFVESAVNQIVSKRFAKLQQMQWTKKGAHLVLQTGTQVLDGRLERTFRKWYPGFRPQPQQIAA